MPLTGVSKGGITPVAVEPASGWSGTPHEYSPHPGALRGARKFGLRAIASVAIEGSGSSNVSQDSAGCTAGFSAGSKSFINRSGTRDTVDLDYRTSENGPVHVREKLTVRSGLPIERLAKRLRVDPKHDKGRLIYEEALGRG